MITNISLLLGIREIYEDLIPKDKEHKNKISKDNEKNKKDLKTFKPS